VLSTFWCWLNYFWCRTKLAANGLGFGLVGEKQESSTQLQQKANLKTKDKDLSKKQANCYHSNFAFSIESQN
jgi:hypothetical protein